MRDLEQIYALGKQEAEECGLSAMDAFHVAAAHLLRADELVTAEKPGKALYRAKRVWIVYLFDLPTYRLQITE